MITPTKADERLNAAQEITLIKHLKKLGIPAGEILKAIIELKKT